MARKTKKIGHKLGMEGLEGRQMMTVDLTTALFAAWAIDSMSDDQYESNDSRSDAADLGTINASRTVSDLRMADSQDWFRFRIPEGRTGGSVQIDFRHSSGDLDVRLYDANGSEVGRSTGVGDQERISLDNQPAGVYFVKIYGYNGVHNRNYSLSINPGAVVAPPVTQTASLGGDDRYEDNDTQSQAANLGAISGEQRISSLAMQDECDWFRFRLNHAGGSNDYVRVDFQHSQGDIDVKLYDASGTAVRFSMGTGNSENLSLDGLAAGDYYVKVFGYRGVHNPEYSLTIKAGDGTTSTSSGSDSAGNSGTALQNNVSTLATDLGLAELLGTQPFLPAAPPAQLPWNAGFQNPGFVNQPVGVPWNTNFNPVQAPAPVNPTALAWSPFNANGVDLLNTLLSPLPTTFGQLANDPWTQLHQAPRHPGFDNGLGQLPLVASSQLVHDVLRSDIAQHADPMDVLMWGGVRPGIYYQVEQDIARNFSNGATNIDVAGVNRHYGIGDGNLDLLAQVGHGAFGPQQPNQGIRLPLFQMWGWGQPIS